jgi:hypothetical protein
VLVKHLSKKSRQLITKMHLHMQLSIHSFFALPIGSYIVVFWTLSKNNLRTCYLLPNSAVHVKLSLFLRLMAVILLSSQGMIHWVAYGYVLHNKYMGLPRATGNRNSTQQKSPGTPRDGSRVLLPNLTFLFWGCQNFLLSSPCCFSPPTMLSEFPLGLLVHQAIPGQLVC